jgi:hypothetical protein
MEGHQVCLTPNVAIERANKLQLIHDPGNIRIAIDVYVALPNQNHQKSNSRCEFSVAQWNKNNFSA